MENLEKDITSEELINLISSGLSLRKISNRSGKSLSSIRYWVKKYKISHLLKTKNPTITDIKRKCPKCNMEKELNNFYKRRGKLFSSTYCKECTSSTTVERMRVFKSRCVEYKGGKCYVCGYNKYLGALEFHHMDPNEKDFTISHMKKYSFDDIVKYELGFAQTATGKLKVG